MGSPKKPASVMRPTVLYSVQYLGCDENVESPQSGVTLWSHPLQGSSLCKQMKNCYKIKYSVCARILFRVQYLYLFLCNFTLLASSQNKFECFPNLEVIINPYWC